MVRSYLQCRIQKNLDRYSERYGVKLIADWEDSRFLSIYIDECMETGNLIATADVELQEFYILNEPLGKAFSNILRKDIEEAFDVLKKNDSRVGKDNDCKERE